MFQDYYPSLLLHVFVINAPWYLKTAWRFTKGKLLPATRDKFSFLMRKKRRGKLSLKKKRR